MKKYIPLWILLAVLFSACSKAELNEVHLGSSSLVEQRDEDIVFEEGVPTIGNGQSLRAISTDNPVEWVTTEHYLYYLGKSFIFPDDPNPAFGIKNQVLNIRTLIQDPALEGRIVITPISQTRVDKEVHRSLDHARRVTTDKTTKKLGGGLTLGPFKIGGSRTKEKYFTTYKEDFENSFFASLSVNYTGHHIALSLSRNDRARIIERHLSPGFIRGLYTSPIGEVSKNVSPFVLCSYSTGGQLHTMHQITNVWHRDADSLYTFVQKKIDGSIDEAKRGQLLGKKIDSLIQKIGEVKLSIDWSKENTNTESNFKLSEEDNGYHTITTWGGVLSSGLNLPASARPLDIDFAPWLQSLTDTKTHRLVEISDGGLYPISEFILEKNFSQRLIDTYKGVVSSFESNLSPSIEVANVFVREGATGSPLCDIALVLHTRNGDRLILTELRNHATDSELEKSMHRDYFTRRGKELLAELSNNKVYLGLRKSGNPKKVLRTYLRQTASTFAVLNYGNMYKYHNPNNKVLYLYDEKARVAFSCYKGEEGDINLLEEYGLSTWVATLPEKKISVERLMQDFKVLGL